MRSQSSSPEQFYPIPGPSRKPSRQSIRALKMPSHIPIIAPPPTVALTPINSSPHFPTLAAILADKSEPPYTLTAFMAFLSQNHALENLEFILDAARYTRTYSTRLCEEETLHSPENAKYLKMLWSRLMDAYIRSGGSREVNIPGVLQDALLRVPNEDQPAPPDALSASTCHVVKLMEDSLYTPFLMKHMAAKAATRISSAAGGYTSLEIDSVELPSNSPYHPNRHHVFNRNKDLIRKLSRRDNSLGRRGMRGSSPSDPGDRSTSRERDRSRIRMMGGFLARSANGKDKEPAWPANEHVLLFDSGSDSGYADDLGPMPALHKSDSSRSGSSPADFDDGDLPFEPIRFMAHQAVDPLRIRSQSGSFSSQRSAPTPPSPGQSPNRHKKGATSDGNWMSRLGLGMRRKGSRNSKASNSDRDFPLDLDN